MEVHATETIDLYTTPGLDREQRRRSASLFRGRWRKIGIRFPLYLKFITGISVLMCLFMLAVITIVDYQMRRSILEEFSKRGLTVVRNLAAVNTSFIATYNYVKIEQSTEYVVKENDLLYASVQFFDGEAASYSGRDDFKDLILTGPLHDKALGCQQTLIQQHTHRGIEFCEIAVPIFLDQQKWGTVRVGFPLDHMHTAVLETRKMLLLFGIIALLIGCVASNAVSRKITQPIGKLVKSVEAISCGDYERSIDTNTRDEIGYLGRRFNTMQSTIKEHLGLLTEKNQALIDSNTELRNEIRERKQAEAALHRRDEILKAVTFASERLLRELRWQDSILEIFEQLGTAIGAHGIGLYPGEVDFEEGSMDTPLFAWKSDAVPPYLETTTVDESGEWVNSVSISDRARETVPIIVGGTLWGILKVEGILKESGMFLASLDAVKTVAGNLGSAIQRAQTIERLKAANCAKDDFLANMSHELRTPLNHIIGFTELVTDRRVGPLNTKQDNYLNCTLQSGRHLLALINDILDLSKVEAGKMDLEPEPIDLNLLLSDSLNFVKEKAIRHDIELISNIEKLPDSIVADERKLKQVLFNILSNSLKFTPDGGRIIIGARMVDCVVQANRRKGDRVGRHVIRVVDPMEPSEERDRGAPRPYVQVSVQDTGIGIHPMDLKRIFNRFDQVENAKSRKRQGSGLGLSLAKSFIELHGGKIWAESEGKDRGSVFRFVIPAQINHLDD